MSDTMNKRLRAMLDRIAAIPEVADCFHAPAEESIADGVEGAIETMREEAKGTRDDALEEAAVFVETRVFDGDGLVELRSTQRQLAAALRALKARSRRPPQSG